MNRCNNPRILLVNTHDLGGGAEKVAMDLHMSFRELGFHSKMVVGRKKTDLPSVYEIPKTNWYQFWRRLDEKVLLSKLRGVYRFHKIIKPLLSDPFLEQAIKQGKENYHYPESRKTLKNSFKSIDIFHLHNLHNQYFDLTYLPSLSKKKPVLITLHDEYLYTGHCAYTLDCERWKIGCGDCPHLDIYPAVKCDNTRFNWQRKKTIFSKSDLTLIAPSQWLAQRVEHSLLSHLPVRVIPNGVDQDIFKPGSKQAAREELGLAQDAFVILYVATSGRQSPFKDYEMLDRVIERLKFLSFAKPILFLALGGNTYQKRVVPPNLFIEKPFEKDPLKTAKHYQACDLYIHTSKADNFPLVILEAMACGKVIVSTDAGGIPEQVEEDITGYLAPVGDDEKMARQISKLVESPELIQKMGENAQQIAREKYGLQRMVEAYLDLYTELIKCKEQK